MRAMTCLISSDGRVSVPIVSRACSTSALAADAASVSPPAEALSSVAAVATCSLIAITTDSNPSARVSREVWASCTRCPVSRMAPRAVLMSTALCRKEPGSPVSSISRW